MLDDPSTVAEFYRTPRGRAAARLLRRQMRLFWPDLTGQTLVGIGYASPFLPLWRGQARRCVEAVPVASGTRVLPRGAASRCLVAEDALPFDELSIDRILLVHALEVAEHAPRLLRAVWRALRDDGRLLLLVPNRIGFWAHNDGTPFGDGAPSSAGHLERTLARGMFRIERRSGALYLPLIGVGPLARLCESLEPAARLVLRGFPGVFLVEAVKDVYAALPADGEPQRRLLSTLPAAVVPAKVAHGRGRNVAEPAAAQAAMPIAFSSSRSK